MVFELGDLSRAGTIPHVYVHRRTDHKRVFLWMYDMFVGGVSEVGESAELKAPREPAEELRLTRVLRDGSTDREEP